MRYFPYLRKKFPLYIASGIILACTILGLSIAHEYNDHLSQALHDLQNLNIKIVKIKEEIGKIDGMLERLRHGYQIDLNHTDQRRSLSQANSICQSSTGDTL